MTEWDKIVKEIYDYSENMLRNQGVTAWFRGQSKAGWILESTLHRYVRKSVYELNEQWSMPEALRKQYKTLYFQYRERAWSLLIGEEKEKWGTVFSMRHYGVPTTLLDWTESFAYAVYFANLNRTPSEDAAIFVVNPPELNNQAVNQKHLFHLPEGFDKDMDDRISRNMDREIRLKYYHPAMDDKFDLPSIAVTPVFTNHRMRVQKSKFVICGDCFKPLEDEYKKCIKKFILPASTYEDSKKFLKMHNITRFTVFPDLDALKDDIMDELGLQIDLLNSKPTK